MGKAAERTLAQRVCEIVVESHEVAKQSPYDNAKLVLEIR